MKDGHEVFATLEGFAPIMDIRDQFACAAMQGDWSNGNEGTWGNDANISDLEKRAALYYRMADAMLKERDK